MNKYVYLYELDSVRNSEQELFRAHQSMYEEIVENGNCVVLTYNQLTDSQAFLSLLKEDDSYHDILRLFELGVIKVARFQNVRTPSQYIQDKLQNFISSRKSSFIFSAFPIMCKDDILPEKLLQSLQYGDPELISDYIIQQDIIDEKVKSRIEFAKRYVQMIIDLSSSNLNGKFSQIVLSEEKNYISFSENMNVIINYLMMKYEFITKEYQSACILQTIYDQLGNTKMLNSRSAWLIRLANRKVIDEPSLFSEVIIDICYNVTVENNIHNVARHYEIGNDAERKNGFLDDFDNRVTLYWKDCMSGIHKFYILREKEGHEISAPPVKIQWKAAVRYVERYQNLLRIKGRLPKFMNKKDDTDTENADNYVFYEMNYDQEKNRWKHIRTLSVFYALLSVIMYLLLNNIVDAAPDLVENGFVFKNLILILNPSNALNLLFFGCIGSGTAYLFHLMDYMEIIKECCLLFIDLLSVRITRKRFGSVAYINKGKKHE